jgi:N-acetylglucosamine-6-sulfatase
VKYSSGEVELFDLANDPLEMDSLADDPAYADVRRALDVAWRSFRDVRRCKECDIPLPPGHSVTDEDEDRRAPRRHAAAHGPSSTAPTDRVA